MLPRDEKILKQSPCLFLEWNETRQRFEACAPAVDCSFSCESCGWNPSEKARRLEEGAWAYNENGVRRLLFKGVWKTPE